MTSLTQFDTPGSLRDAPADSPFYRRWHDWLAEAIDDLSPGPNGGGFYDPTATPVTIQGSKTLTWMGFPRQVLFGHRDDRRAAYVVADADLAARDPQNEYFEWYVERAEIAGQSKITKVTFVTEVPEYYEQLWDLDPQLVVAVYRQLVSPSVTQADLADGGSAYNKFNRWNTTDGIVHYIQSINTLSAAVGLSQGAAVEPAVEDNYEVGDLALTSVDPRVGLDVRMLARQGLLVTLADPVGLYMVEWNDSGFTRPDGSPVGNYWTVRRGTPDRALRLEYEVPADAGFVVGDISIGGHRIEFGGQIAEHVTVGITGQVGTQPVNEGDAP